MLCFPSHICRGILPILTSPSAGALKDARCFPTPGNLLPYFASARSCPLLLVKCFHFLIFSMHSQKVTTNTFPCVGSSLQVRLLKALQKCSQLSVHPCCITKDELLKKPHHIVPVVAWQDNKDGLSSKTLLTLSTEEVHKANKSLTDL